ncbi:hypothetical protein E2542_SST23174 [Spatholobus suberectus]|nr:hypothetical protein E2542_SST23174 [Spatholobus suberectus]
MVEGEEESRKKLEDDFEKLHSYEGEQLGTTVNGSANTIQDPYCEDHDMKEQLAWSWSSLDIVSSLWGVEASIR